MKIQVEVEIHDKIVETIGKEEVQKLLAGFAGDEGEEYLKECYEDKTGVWIDTKS